MEVLPEGLLGGGQGCFRQLGLLQGLGHGLLDLQ